MTRRVLIAGNWKMNLIDSIEPIIEKYGNIDKLDILICPPFTHLKFYKEKIKNTNIHLGAQNMFYELKGAYTGEISPLFLKDTGVDYVILGHSERRHIFNESNEIINKKIKTALNEGFKCIVCVGEKQIEREKNIHKRIIEDQIKMAFMGIENNFENIIIAYEPVWAIGTGLTATPFDAQDMHVFIREKIAEIAGKIIASEMLILYGGSVKKDNVKELLRQDDIDGALIGGASLKYEHFNSIIENVKSIII